MANFGCLDRRWMMAVNRLEPVADRNLKDFSNSDERRLTGIEIYWCGCRPQLKEPSSLEYCKISGRCFLLHMSIYSIYSIQYIYIYTYIYIHTYTCTEIYTYTYNLFTYDYMYIYIYIVSPLTFLAFLPSFFTEVFRLNASWRKWYPKSRSMSKEVSVTS